MSRPPKAASRTSSMHILGALTLASSVTSNRWALLHVLQLGGSPCHPAALRISRSGGTPFRNALPQRLEAFLGRRCSVILQCPFALGLDPRRMVREGPAQMGVPGRESLPFAAPRLRLARAGLRAPMIQLARPLTLSFTAIGPHGMDKLLIAHMRIASTLNAASNVALRSPRRPKPSIRPPNFMPTVLARPARQRSTADFVRPRRVTPPTNFVQHAGTSTVLVATIGAVGVRLVQVAHGGSVSLGSSAAVRGSLSSHARRVLALIVTACNSIASFKGLRPRLLARRCMHVPALIQQMGKIHPLRWPLPWHDPAVIIAQRGPMPFPFTWLEGLPDSTVWGRIASMPGRSMARPFRIATLATPSSARSQCGRKGPPPSTLSLGSTVSRSTNHAFKNISATASHDHVLGPGGTPLGGTTLLQLTCTGTAITAASTTVTVPITLTNTELHLTMPM